MNRDRPVEFITTSMEWEHPLILIHVLITKATGQTGGNMPDICMMEALRRRSGELTITHGRNCSFRWQQQEIRKRMRKEDHDREAVSKEKREMNLEELRKANNVRVLQGLMEDFMEAVG